jgi:large conductance mechanosensitive channel
MLNEFKTFAMRGNVIDLAVGVIIGSAFGRIVTSLVEDVIMPPLGLLLARVDFSNLYFNLSNTSYPTLAAAKAAGAPTVNYGAFLNTLVNFLIIAFVVFMLVRQINRLKDTEPPPSPTTKACPYCHSTISVKAVRCPQCTSDISHTPTTPQAKPA